MAERIQLRRTKGWRMPPNTVKVTRPGPFGNPFRADQDAAGKWYVVACDGSLRIPKFDQQEAVLGAVRLFRAYLANDGTQPGANRDSGGAMIAERARTELRGKNLACFCPLGKPCHADVLLEIAAAPSEESRQG